jgi:hypothetical protein
MHHPLLLLLLLLLLLCVCTREMRGKDVSEATGS